jgi:hypothetical protein
MTEEIVPDDLVQNWPLSTQALLVAAINDLLTKSPYLTKMKPLECEDIVVCGSRVHGGYKLDSDMDAVAYIKNYTPPKLPGRDYFRHREILKFMNIKVDVWLRCPDDIALGIFPGHPDAPSELGWRLPYYSLITHNLMSVIPSEIESYFQFMYPMKPGMASGDRRWEKLISEIKLPF